MSTLDYKLHDGQLTASVNDDDITNTIHIEFNTKDDSPEQQEDPAKVALAMRYGAAVKAVLDRFKPEDINEPAALPDGNIGITAKFDDVGAYLNALGATDTYFRVQVESPEKKAAESEKAEQPREVITLDDSEFNAPPPPTPPHMPAGPIPRKRVQHPPGIPSQPPELTLEYSYLKRIKIAQRDAKEKSTARAFALDSNEGGLNAQAFPVPLHIVSGKQEDIVTDAAPQVPDTRQVVITVNAGNSADPRAEVVRMTNEIEKRFKMRGLIPARAEVYHSSSGNAARDTGVIVIPGGGNAAQTINDVNEVLADVSENAAVLKAKLGRGRGEDYLQRNPTPLTVLDAQATALLEALKEAEADGALKLNVSGDLLNQWVAWLSFKSRSAGQEPEQGRG